MQSKRAWGDMVSTLNIALGGIALMYILDGGATSYAIASMLMFAILGLDGLDGPIAGRSKKTIYGPYLDSISDGIGFILLPSLLMYSVYYIPGVSSFQEPQNALVVGTLSIYIAVGFRRLAHIAVSKRRTSFFVGAPVSLPAVAVVAMYGLGLPWWTVLSILFALTLLVLSSLHFPKMRGLLVAGGSLVVFLGITAFYLEILDDNAISRAILYAILAMCTIYSLSFPLAKRSIPLPKGLK